MLKRTFDIVISSIALTVLAPLLVAIAVAVRLDSPGPALFRQCRVGKSGKDFTILKFRSMHHTIADQNGPKITAAGDSRVTRLGRLLRRTKLDELPQLWNVVRGDMSLVGPRPEVPEYVATYDESQREILQYRPGITCPSSLDMIDEEELLAASDNPQRYYREVLLPRKLSIAQRYAENARVTSDIVILFKTAARIASIRTRHRRHAA